MYRHEALLLRKIRESLGLNQGELAQKLGHANSQFISNIERGTCGIPATSVKKLAKLSGYDVELIIDAVVTDFKIRFLAKM
jgi:transcriptional regulator with XRE-family HTH domain